MANTNNTNQQYRNIIDTSLMTDKNDDRLPRSLLTLDEYNQCIALAEKCRERQDTSNKIKKLSISNPEHPYHELFIYLSKIAEALKGTDYEHHCVICGDKLPTKTFYPYCTSCGRLVYRGLIRGKSCTRGYRNFGKICVVCGEKPAMAAGMCRACYRVGDRHGTHDPEEIKQIRQTFCKPKRVSNGDGNTGLVPKVWEL